MTPPRSTSRPLPKTFALTIGATWNGLPIAQDEWAHLRITADARTLTVNVDAPFHGDPEPPHPRGPTDGLWEHEVVELFVASTGDPSAPIAYTEIELGPHGHHLVLRHNGIRNRIAGQLPLEFTSRIDGKRWTGTASLDRAHLPPCPWSVGAFAIHGIGSRRRYLAMIGSEGRQPDFHRPDRFVPLAALRPEL